MGGKATIYTSYPVGQEQQELSAMQRGAIVVAILPRGLLFFVALIEP